MSAWRKSGQLPHGEPDEHGNTKLAQMLAARFTDVVAIDDAGRVWTHKVPSTPPHFEQAVLAAVAHILQASGAVRHSGERKSRTVRRSPRMLCWNIAARAPPW